MSLRPTTRRPVIISGGMGAGVSSWRLAQSVARTGQLGVISGMALDAVVSRRLQDGDPGGHVHRALVDFPLQGVRDRVLDRYFLPGGRGDAPYRTVPKPTIEGRPFLTDLLILGNFVEVWLAKQGHSGLVGIGLPTIMRLTMPASIYGAMLAGVDFVLAGAQVAGEIPRLLDDLTAGRRGFVDTAVAGLGTFPVTFDPATVGGDRLSPLARPVLLATGSARLLTRTFPAAPAAARPDGVVVEGCRRAPGRHVGADDEDLAAVAALGLPFWLAGGFGEPELVRWALDRGASGVQVGTLFALCRESGLAEPLREALLHNLRGGTLTVRTEAAVSPTEEPFEVASLATTLSDPTVFATRSRRCDLGYLRVPYVRPDGRTGYRCPAEPVEVYLRKGGREEDTCGARCLCNALLADAGLGSVRRDGYREPALVTLSAELSGARRLDAEHWLHGGDPDGWSAREAVEWLLREVGTPAETVLAVNDPVPASEGSVPTWHVPASDNPASENPAPAVPPLPRPPLAASRHRRQPPPPRKPHVHH